MSINEIYKKIDLETAVCVEDKFDFWEFKARRNYDPKCRADVTQKYQKELSTEIMENESVQDSIDAKLKSGKYDILITLVVAIFILSIAYYYLTT